MIKIIKGQANTVVLTLLEKQTLLDPAFLFEFTNQMTGEVKVFTAADISTATSRYNRFIITETTLEDFYTGHVELLAGFWLYSIYEITKSSPQDLNPLHAADVVETGKVIVVGTAIEPTYWDTTWVKDVPTWNP